MSAYDFVDVTQSPPVKKRPAEAACFNGKWLDDEIDGFRTLNIQGRELLGKDIDTRDAKKKYGEEFERAAYRPRTIVVTYQLKAESSELFRERYNELNGLLSAEQAQLVFYDEPDKHFIATKASNDEVAPGLNSVIGTIEFYCADPAKYSTTLKEFTASVNDDGVLEATIVNDGSVEAPISYNINFNDESGYIGIVSEDGIIQLGQPQEVDGAYKSHAENLVLLADFISAADDHGTCYLQTDADTSGSCTAQSIVDATWLGMKDGGSGAGWNGGQRTVTIPEDSSGQRGAVNWQCHMFRWFQEATARETGENLINIMGDDNTQIAGIKVYDLIYGSYSGVVEFWANGRMYARKKFRPGERVWTPGAAAGSYNTFHWTNGNDVIIKEGQKITFYFDNEYFSWNIPEIADVKATRIQMTFLRYGTEEYCARNYFKEFTFANLNVSKWVDVQNRYQPGDEVYIDGESTKVYVNDMPRANDEVTGSRYFLAKPGETKVQFFYSDFCSVAPTIKATIREAYL